LAALSGELAKGDAAVANGIDTIGPAVGVLASENSDFDKLLASANQLSLVATSTVQTSSASFLGTIHQLDAVLNQMVGVESQLGPTLTDLARFEAMTPRVAPGDYLQLSLNGTVTINQTPLLGASNVAGPTGPVTAASGASNDAAIRGLLGAGLP
jgi:ABC-type transporter Mla subunit MlaD